MDPGFVAFLGISAIVIVTPGQDTALTIRNTLLGGRTAGVATAAGVAMGQGVWTVAAAVGLTALLVASEPAFAAVRLLGAAYLILLGLHTLRNAVRPSAQSSAGASAAPPGLRPRQAFRQGALSNLGNPKMAVFFSSLLPPFAGDGDLLGLRMLALGAVFVTMTLAWLSAYAVVVDRVGDVLRRPRIRRAIDAVTGVVLVAFGARLAVERR